MDVKNALLHGDINENIYGEYRGIFSRSIISL
jgi:hypothetical protein